MSKVSAGEKFFDVSDYGRPAARFAANQLAQTKVTPIHVTLLFGVCGLVAVYSIIQGYYIIAAIFLILKSVIDAVDGELARAKKTASYTGRYLDSVFDYILNFLLLMAIWSVTGQPFWLFILAFFSLQLQGTLYNYYYVILRHQSATGDKTSQIFETETPNALPGESQKNVNILFTTYRLFYSIFDKIIYWLDRDAHNTKPFPKWFMTAVSIYGLGFQLLILALMLAANLIEWILPFLIVYSLFIPLFIGIRKIVLGEKLSGNKTSA